MTVHAATPYLILNGKASEAITHYQHALGAKVESRQRFGDMDQSCPEAMRDRIMHAELRVGAATLMMSDGPGEGPAPSGGAVSVALHLDDAEELRRIFGALSEAGMVVQPVIDAPWGGLFGALHDRFGVSWMFNCTPAPS